jgi:hypothetical protein
MTRYLTSDELIYINDQLPAKAPIHTIVQGKRKVRDMDLLEAAVGRPMLTAFGEPPYKRKRRRCCIRLPAIIPLLMATNALPP